MSEKDDLEKRVKELEEQVKVLEERWERWFAAWTEVGLRMKMLSSQ
ncbi:hypothetical protein MUO79_00645 [Candidatus Bathyarchaeota archaeon]|nr:hypothetical protein [Candidatus Bathyarchaeota archaeon]